MHALHAAYMLSNNYSLLIGQVKGLPLAAHCLNHCMMQDRSYVVHVPLCVHGFRQHCLAVALLSQDCACYTPLLNTHCSKARSTL